MRLYCEGKNEVLFLKSEGGGWGTKQVALTWFFHCHQLIVPNIILNELQREKRGVSFFIVCVLANHLINTMHSDWSSYWEHGEYRIVGIWMKANKQQQHMTSGY